MKKPILVFTQFLLIANSSFAQEAKNPKLALALQSLEQTEAEVASSIVKTTSVLHRLEKALMIDKLYEKAIEVPSSVYIGVGGVAFGGLVFTGVGSATKQIAAGVGYSGESFKKITHNAQSVQNGFRNSGTAMETVIAPAIKNSGKSMARFGDAWWNVTKLIVDNPASRKSGNIFIQYVVKPAQTVINKTTDYSSQAAEFTYDGLAAIYKFINHNILRFGEATAANSGKSSASATMTASVGYSIYVGFNRGKNLYDSNINLSDEKIQSIILSDSQISQNINDVSEEISTFFSLDANQKAKFKENLSNDLVTAKLLQFRAEAETSDDLEDVRADYKETLEEDFSLSAQEIEAKLAAFDALTPNVTKRSNLKEGSEVQVFNILNSAKSVLNEGQLAALAAIKGLYDAKAAAKALESSLKLSTTDAVLSEIDNNVKVLEVLKAYISQVEAFKDVFGESAVLEVNALIKDLNQKIENIQTKADLLE